MMANGLKFEAKTPEQMKKRLVEYMRARAVSCEMTEDIAHTEVERVQNAAMARILWNTAQDIEGAEVLS